MADDEVQQYLRAVANQTRKAFSHSGGHAPGSGAALRSSAGELPPATKAPPPTVAVSCQGVTLPPRKKMRSESPDNKGPPPVSAFPATTAVPQVAAKATVSPKPQSLLSRYFPSRLRAPTLSAAQLPPPSLKTATVARVEMWRSRVVLLRAALGDGGAEDAEACALAGIGPKEARRIGRGLATLRRDLRIPSDAADLAAWHRFVETHGPTRGQDPPSSLVVLLDEAESNSLMHVVCTKILRGQRKLDVGSGGGAKNMKSVKGSNDEENDVEGNDEDASGVGKLYVNDSEDGSSARGCDSDAEASTNKMTSSVARINDVKERFADSLTAEVRETLRFFRHIMPIDLIDDGGGGSDGILLKSSGLGAWFFAAAVAVDLPVDPELDRHFNDLFKACCKHLTVVSEHVGGSSIEVPLLARIEQSVGSSSSLAFGGKQYWVVTDIGESEVMALFAMIVILAKILRQNQNNVVPI